MFVIEASNRGDVIKIASVRCVWRGVRFDLLHYQPEPGTLFSLWIWLLWTQKRNPITLSSTEQSGSSLLMFSLELFVVCSDLLLLEMMGHSAEAVGSRVTLPSGTSLAFLTKIKEYPCVEIQQILLQIPSSFLYLSTKFLESNWWITSNKYWSIFSTSVPWMDRTLSVNVL